MDLPEHCTDVRAALHLFVGADLDESEMTSVRTHIETCTPCGVAVERAREARAVLRAERERLDAAPAPALWEGLRTELASEGLLRKVRPLQAVPAGREPRALGTLHRMWIGGAAAAAAVLLVVGLAGRGDGTRDLAPDPVGPTAGLGSTLEGATPVAHESAPTKRTPALVAQPGVLRPANADEAMMDNAVDPWELLIGTRRGQQSTSNQLTGGR